MATVTDSQPLTTLSKPNDPEPIPSNVTEPDSPPEVGLTLYRMSYDLYQRIAQLELLGSKDKVVLLDGLLVNQMTKGFKHRGSVVRGLKALQSAVPAGWDVWPEQPIALRDGPDGDSAPEPDLVVVYGDLDRYEDRDPINSEIGMVIEVSSRLAAVRIDRAWLSRYAHAGIPIACIVNIPDRSVEVYTEPSGPSVDPGYRRFETLRPGQTLAGEIGNALTGPAALIPIPVEVFFGRG